MRLLWLCLLLQSVLYSEASFGTSYLENSRLCHNWSCVNSKLGLPNSLPSREQYTQVFKSLLPPGAWHDVVGRVLETCYEHRQRNYVSTCPGQALLHCTVDNLIENCPEESTRKDDGCYPVSSLAGTKYMFTQSRYENLEKNLPRERRPAWFMRNYFNAKCCNLPQLINSTVLKECGFNHFINYYDHKPRTELIGPQPHYMKHATTQKAIKHNSRIFDFNSIPVTEKRPEDDEDQLRIVSLYPEENNNDALSCCDMSDFIDPSWQSECGFNLNWDKRSRLNVAENLAATTTVPPTTPAPVNKDVRVVPLSCEKETCVFRKLNIVSESGSVDMDAFSKLLDNFTGVHPAWAKAKARVITMCISRPNHGYQGDCEINKLLACTLDVLSENCPYGSKNDSCRHSRRNNTVCQISTSRYRPKNRRAICGLPNLVNSEVLSECGVTSISRSEYVPENKPKLVQGWRTSKYACKDSTPPTACIMTKMGILNTYGFMDYFKMKDRIRSFTSKHQEWSPFLDVYINAFSGMPLYREHCNSPKKLLNVVDAMLMTCPVTKRSKSPQCIQLLIDMTNTAPVNDNQNVTKEKLNSILQHFNHMFLPSSQLAKKTVYKRTNPLYNFGMLNSTNIPPVEVIDLKTTKNIPVILPVYMRTRNDLLRGNTASSGPYENGVFQTSSYLLHGKIPVTKPTLPTVPMFPNMP
ncbi:uncharacterized protein LOC114359411 [Ostrinia furnacalis]|uniref:uncharacterized protein LOC114359411 n=1 Tax=Ostrinia furnacalis TaxID=93504 RepID=UPI001039561A|nr:uncharacterized protein LOC114359411 [Ostrinia furnacalis]